jgi:hypothetical protein
MFISAVIIKTSRKVRFTNVGIKKNRKSCDALTLIMAMDQNIISASMAANGSMKTDGKMMALLTI